MTSTYHYTTGARLTGITTAGVTESRTTDNGGRETALALVNHQLALTYDSDDHVTRVVDGATTTNYAFDAAGRRVSATSGGNVKRFLQAPNGGDGYESPQAVTDASGALIASYVFAGEIPIAKSTASGTQYYLTDAMGSVIATASDTGVLGATLDYDAFGNERTSGALTADTYGDFRLHGMWKDPSGLYYVRARNYDAESGRFTSRDPHPGHLRRPESFASYAFARHNPFLWSDRTGQFAVAISINLGAISALATVAFVTSAFIVSYILVEIHSYINQASDGTPRDNRAQNKQFQDAVKQIEREIGRRLSKDEIRRLHDAITGQNLGFHDIVREGLDMFGDNTYIDDDEGMEE